MNVQKRERPRRMQFLEKRKKKKEKKVSRVSRVQHLMSLFHRFALFLFENIQFSLVNPGIEFPTKNRPVLIMNYNARMARTTNQLFLIFVQYTRRGAVSCRPVYTHTSIINSSIISHSTVRAHTHKHTYSVLLHFAATLYRLCSKM